MTNTAHPTFARLAAHVRTLYDADPAENHPLIRSLLAGAAAAGYRQSAEALLGELYSFEQGQQL